MNFFSWKFALAVAGGWALGQLAYSHGVGPQWNKVIVKAGW